MPVIHVEMFSGRDTETKKQLVKKLTDAYVEVCDLHPDTIHIILQEVEKSDWAKGGKLFSELMPD